MTYAIEIYNTDTHKKEIMTAQKREYLQTYSRAVIKHGDIITLFRAYDGLIMDMYLMFFDRFIEIDDVGQYGHYKEISDCIEAICKESQGR